MLRSVMIYTGPVRSPYRQIGVVKQVSVLYIGWNEYYVKPILRLDMLISHDETSGNPDMDQCVI